MSSWSKVPVTSATVWYNDNNAGNNKYADMGRSGSSGVAHAVSSLGGKGFQNYAFKAAKCIATNYKTFPDTHGSAILGMGWTALGATVDKASFRSPMNNYVWYFNLAHCPNGTFYFQPNRDPNAQDIKSYHSSRAPITRRDLCLIERISAVTAEALKRGSAW